MNRAGSAKQRTPRLCVRIARQKEWLMRFRYGPPCFTDTGGRGLRQLEKVPVCLDVNSSQGEEVARSELDRELEEWTTIGVPSEDRHVNGRIGAKGQVCACRPPKHVRLLPSRPLDRVPLQAALPWERTQVGAPSSIVI